MFSAKSRYAQAASLLVQDGRGRSVEVVLPAAPPQQGLLGVHLRRQGERSDHLAARYLADPTGYWRLAEMNDAMTAEVVSELREVKIPDAASNGGGGGIGGGNGGGSSGGGA